MDKLIVIAAGAAVGAVSFSELALEGLGRLIPAFRNDGQSGMMVYLTAPVGAVLGAAVAAAKCD